MTSSPCKTCHKRNQPKKLCISTCKKLQNLQNAQHFMTLPPHTSAGADSGQFRLAVPASRGSSA